MLNEPVRGLLPDPGFFSLSGIEQMRAYLHERMPGTPHARLLGYRLTQASSGTAVLSLPIVPWFEVYDGFIDLSAVAQLGTSVAARTAAPPATNVRAATLSLRYLRPCTVDETGVIARSRVLHAGSQFTSVETLIEDSLGRAVAHATGCVLVEALDPPPPALAYPLDEQIEDPVYPTPDPPRRRVPSPMGADGLPLLARFLGLDVIESSPERAVSAMPASPWFCNVRREVEPGILASQASLTGVGVLSQLVAPDERAFTFEVTSSFLSPVVADGRPVTATARLHSRVDDYVIIDFEVADADGRRVLVGRASLLIRARRVRPQRRPSNRVLVTVLFTDLVESTERARAAGDEKWREVLDEHHSVVRREIKAHMGREVKTTGDGFLITFDSPSSAVHCALAIRDAITKLGLEIRAGLHTGECEVVGGDVAGVAVHVAARVQRVAAPGQILASTTVRDLVAGSGLDLADAGPYQLKGLEGDWNLVSVEG